MKILLTLILTISTVSTFAGELALLSRNMPQSCQYVFKVETDIRLEIPLNSEDDEVVYQLQNAWKPAEWTSPRKLSLNSSRDKLVGEVTLESMSLPGNYLYRMISITFPKAQIKCQSEFGREFGEACMSGGRSETPWRIRQVFCQRQH